MALRHAIFIGHHLIQRIEWRASSHAKRPRTPQHCDPINLASSADARNPPRDKIRRVPLPATATRAMNVNGCSVSVRPNRKPLGVLMATAHDVAAYILKTHGAMTAMKLQKLVYYSQAWSLVWDERPIFADRIEAWANGPVVPTLYEQHRGQFMLSSLGDGNADALTEDERETVAGVLKFYGDKDSQWLSDLTHRETPWREARQGLRDGERGNVEITHAALFEYYGGLA